MVFLAMQQSSEYNKIKTKMRRTKTPEIVLHLLFTFLLLDRMCVCSIQSPASCLPDCHCRPVNHGDTLRIEMNCRNGEYSAVPNPVVRERGDEKSPPAVISLNLANNSVSHLDLVFLSEWSRLEILNLSNNKVKSVAKSTEDFSPLESLKVLDLSRNSLQVLHSIVFVGLPSLRTLNLSHNQIHTVSEGAFVLPSLVELDISHNAMTEAPTHLFDTSPHIDVIEFSHNRISRLLDGTFSLLVNIKILDFSHNSIMGIDDNTFVGINTTFLDLSYNNFRKMPNLALRKLKAVTTLVLDANLFQSLENGCIHDIKVKFLSISHCKFMDRLDQSSIGNLPDVETITLNNNPTLKYFHPGAVSNVPNLVALLLNNNNLSSLEDIQPYIPSLRKIFLKGNMFQCHCSLRWIQNVIQNEDKLSGFVVQDGRDITCGENKDKVSQVRLSDSECQPYILPLFPQKDEVMMGHNLTWLCKMVGSRKGTIVWTLPHGQELGEGDCWQDRACVREGRLKLSFLHPEDVGDYRCIAKNIHGNNSRTVYLEVKFLNIQVFPVAIAATFVTLSWNTSQSLSRDFILQVEKVPMPSSHHSPQMDKGALKSIKNPILQYNNIEVGHKMNSYTISDLLPSTSYNVLLCLKKNSHVIPVSSLRVTTRPESYMHQLGIKKDYTAITAVVVVLGLATASCVGMSMFRIYRFKCSIQSDSISTKEMIVSPSEPDSLAYSSPYSPYCEYGPKHKDLDQSRLVENEVASPTEDVSESSA